MTVGDSRLFLWAEIIRVAVLGAILVGIVAFGRVSENAIAPMIRMAGVKDVPSPMLHAECIFIGNSSVGIEDRLGHSDVGCLLGGEGPDDVGHLVTEPVCSLSPYALGWQITLGAEYQVFVRNVCAAHILDIIGDGVRTKFWMIFGGRSQSQASPTRMFVSGRLPVIFYVPMERNVVSGINTEVGLSHKNISTQTATFRIARHPSLIPTEPGGNDGNKNGTNSIGKNRILKPVLFVGFWLGGATTVFVGEWFCYFTARRKCFRTWLTGLVLILIGAVVAYSTLSLLFLAENVDGADASATRYSKRSPD